MREALVVGNWKMNGTQESVRSLVLAIVDQEKEQEQSKSCNAVVCPPFVFLSQVDDLRKNSNLQLGAQNLDWHEMGAFTGEISAEMLVELNCQYSIVGHSERRSIYRESDKEVASKFAACVKAGIKPILCLGETLEERMAGETEQIVARQLVAVLEEVGVKGFRDAVIAYEPVWAIGTGETATPAQAETVHGFIRNRLAENDLNISENIQILYGGSVNEKNAADLFAMQNIDGALVGGASLKAKAFMSICGFAQIALSS